MSFEPDFLQMMGQTITVSTRSSLSADGHASYSSDPVDYPARIVTSNKQVRDQRGNVVRSSHVAWIASTETLVAESKYELPDGSSPPVLLVESYPDETGTHHHKVTFGYR